MKYRSSLILGLCLACSPFAAVALGPIVITPTRTEQPENRSSATVYVVTRSEIEASNATTTSQLLRGIPGIQIVDLFGNGTDASVSIRGFGSTANANTLVLVNGRRLNHSDIASPDLHHVFPKDIERIEVLVGSAGSLYGDQAVGGVVNIITRGTEQNRHQVSARVGSFDYRGIQFNSSRRLSDELSYRFSAESFETDHYRDHNAEENTNFSGLLDYVAVDDYRVFIEVQEIRDELELPGALLESEFEEDPQQVNSGFASDFIDEDTSVTRLGYERGISGHRFSIDATERETDADIRQSNRDFPSPETGFIKRENGSLNPKLSGTLDFALGTQYVVGIDLEETDFDLEIPFESMFGPGVSSTSNEQKTESLYLQVNPKVTESLQLTFGARRSSVENNMANGFAFPAGIEVDDDATVAELGLAYRIDEQTRLTLRRDENFRFAKVDELASNQDLETQTGTSVEIGLDLVRGEQRLIVSLYRLDLDDEIEFDPTVGLFGNNVNLEDTRRDGLTLSWVGQVRTSLVLRTDIGLVDASFESGQLEGKQVSGVSDEVARLRVDYRGNDYLTTFLEWQYSSPRYAQGDNANEFGKRDSITVINAGIGYEYKAWQVRFRVNNLADEKYAEFISNFGAFQPSPERNYFVTAGYTFE